MPRAAKSAGDDDIEPYYTAKVTLDSPDAIDGSAAPVPALPCTFESIAPSLLTGVLGYIYGTGELHGRAMDTGRSNTFQLLYESTATVETL